MKRIMDLDSKLNDTNLKYGKKIVGYIDLLGFSQKLCESSTVSDFQPLICKLQEVKHGIDYKKTVHISWFSDCCYIWAEQGYIHDFMICMTCLCRDLLTMTIAHEGLEKYQEVKNYLFRGGITYGDFFSLEEFVTNHNVDLENPVQILLGSSIVNAHNLENKIAHTPRIVIDDDFSKCVESNSEVFKSIDFITQDKDGIKYFDYLRFLKNELDEPLPNEIENVIQWAKEEKDKLDKTKSKYEWLIEYLTKHISNNG